MISQKKPKSVLRGGDAEVEHDWALVIRNRAVDAVGRLGDKGSGYERQMGGRVREGTEEMERVMTGRILSLQPQ